MKKKYLLISVMLVTVLSLVFAGGGQDKGAGAGAKKLIYVITPGWSNPYFKTEADFASSKARELGYEVKAYDHGDDANLQSQYIDAAIADKAAAIILDNAGADITVAAAGKRKPPVSPRSLSTAKLTPPATRPPRSWPTTIRVSSLWPRNLSNS
jgi:erythritol transport system substrate-binding protein